ncbi:sugar phosphate isomerase/epimerase [Pullulanibacillus sp. KACC 23026]|uniref:sugar phosphate isomerase/epimerase family protein n=1 Tax=Pullulanibacillus sp. KACC 23026 TaxID=3028315 RepID=UPI0023AEACB9|nr:sugar phosphate isomerase/epimerase [Pullulanibacillus sp. KACC 23026]WEG11843.1 sugar phosphate isomerase/epimerase [Pullulanibacillus sp. KACC 23026]
MTKIPVSLQLFTLRNETEKDFVGTLKRVAELGYNGVEFAGYGGLTASELKNVLADLGLKASSSHVPLDRITNHLEEEIAFNKEIGNRFIVCPFLMPDQRTEAHYKELVKTLNHAGKRLAEEGMTLAYHNHDFELETLSNGKRALDYILDETNPEYVKAEFDIYWLAKAGEVPAEWLKRYEGRTPLVHLKDMTTDSEQFFAELGTGGVDLEAVLALGQAQGVEWWVVEQDQSKRDPFKSIEISINYLKEKGII